MQPLQEHYAYRVLPGTELVGILRLPSVRQLNMPSNLFFEVHAVIAKALDEIVKRGVLSVPKSKQDAHQLNTLAADAGKNPRPSSVGVKFQKRTHRNSCAHRDVFCKPGI